MASALQKMQKLPVVVWLKIREHDIVVPGTNGAVTVVVWLKIREHDIASANVKKVTAVVVWLKIREHDIASCILFACAKLWFD